MTRIELLILLVVVLAAVMTVWLGIMVMETR
jgi:hypothetical protein